MGNPVLNPLFDFHGPPSMSRIIQPYAFAESFVPADYGTVALWLRPESISGANGSAYTTWTDEGGSANHATQATSGERPTIVTAGAGGVPALLFDGSNDSMTFGADITGSVTVFVVSAIKSVPSNYDPVIIGGFGRICTALGGSNWGTFCGTDVSAGEDLVTDAANLLTLASSVSGNSVSLYRNGALKTFFAAGSSTGGSFRLARESDRVAHVQISEVLIYAGVLAAPELADVHDYFTEKYGL